MYLQMNDPLIIVKMFNWPTLELQLLWKRNLNKHVVYVFMQGQHAYANLFQ